MADSNPPISAVNLTMKRSLTASIPPEVQSNAPGSRDEEMTITKKRKLQKHTLETHRAEEAAEQARLDAENAAAAEAEIQARIAASLLVQWTEMQKDFKRKVDETKEDCTKRISKMLESFTGMASVHVYFGNPDDEFVCRLHALEQLRSAPLNSADPLFPNSEITWISAQGTHLFFDEGTMELVFAVRVRSWDSLSTEDRFKADTIWHILFTYVGATPKIKNNGSQVLKDSTGKVVQEHGDNKTTGGDGKPLKKNGSMYAVGWRGPMGEQGSTIGFYAPARNQKALTKYESAVNQLPMVAKYYAEMLHTIHPGGYLHMVHRAKELKLPSFSDTMIVDGTSVHDPFANSLTITCENFSNYQHRDADDVDFAGGQWTMARKDPNTKQWVIDRSLKHSEVKGGEFLDGKYKVGVDFSKCDGLVDILWHGKVDEHGTLLSSSAPDVTRFGTSVQITRKGALAIQKFWAEGGDSDRVIDAHDRILNLQEALAKGK
ncbi:hypothetical protein C8J56DRAFT_951664 [Mycena floridula]|nr:hypothetical protein C8J56DRAFT_951664 [Mycena floridula]